MRTLTDYANEISTWREQQGFKTPSTIETDEGAEQMLGKLMLVVTEAVEAQEAPDDENYSEELADIAIRILDLVGTLVLPISEHMVIITLDDPHAKDRACSPQRVIQYVCKAAEAVRDHDTDKFTYALALALMATFDAATFSDVDLIEEIEKKMEKNWARPKKHGRKSAL